MIIVFQKQYICSNFFSVPQCVVHARSLCMNPLLKNRAPIQTEYDETPNVFCMQHGRISVYLAMVLDRKDKEAKLTAAVKVGEW